MGLHDQLVGLIIFFCITNTITVGLRVFVRTSLTKGGFGYDDVALVITYVSHSPSSSGLLSPLFDIDFDMVIR